jgi:hypothetical protein
MNFFNVSFYNLCEWRRYFHWNLWLNYLFIEINNIWTSCHVQIKLITFLFYLYFMSLFICDIREVINEIKLCATYHTGIVAEKKSSNCSHTDKFDHKYKIVYTLLISLSFCWRIYSWGVVNIFRFISVAF